MKKIYKNIKITYCIYIYILSTLNLEQFQIILKTARHVSLLTGKTGAHACVL